MHLACSVVIENMKTYAIAIDIGTTNIEAALVKYDTENGIGICAGPHRVMSTISQPNVNRKYGRDVMTRITQAERGHLHEMSTDLRQQISDIIRGLISDAENHCLNDTSDGGISISRIVIACNTTMTHILLEEDCHNMGVYPFRPVHTERIDVMSTEIPVTILPGFSAYVGGDILSGTMAIDLFGRKGRTLFIDLGTNGEMVYYDSDSGRVLVTSTAAGPAFELAGRAKATEIIEGMAFLRNNGIIDETGLLSDEYFDAGYKYKEVNITQKLIRDVQMSKAAIRAGIEILLQRAGKQNVSLSDREEDVIFISGAFGENLDIDAAITLGMLPEAFRDRVILCGNTALSGAIKAIVSDTVVTPPTGYEEIYLSMEEGFSELYMNNMGL